MTRRALSLLASPFLGAAWALFLPACGDDAASSGGTASTGEGAGATTGSQSTGSSQSTATMSSTMSTANTASTASAMTGSTVTSGAGGCYATFDGADDGLFATVGAELGLVDGFSLGAFVNPGDLGPGETAFVAGRHADGFNNGYYLALTNNAGQLMARVIIFTSGGTCIAEGPAAIAPGSWGHILGSWQAPDARVFVDGQLAATQGCTQDGVVIDPPSVFTVGRSVSGIFPYEGAIDDVAYYAQAFVSPFDPATLGCGSSAQLRYSFDAVMVGRATTVAEDCGLSADAQVGSAPGADGADPVFVCP